MVENSIETNGTINNSRFNKLNKPFAVLSSRLNTLNEIINNTNV